MPDLSELFIYSGETRLEFIVWPLFLGVCIGAFITVFIRMKLGEVVRAILEKGARSSESALTLAELGVENKFFVRAALRGKSALRRLIDAVGVEAGSEGVDKKAESAEQTEAEENTDAVSASGTGVLSLESHPDLNKCRFFISDENRDKAESLYNNTNSTVISAVLTVLVAFVVACLSMLLIPNLIQMADNMLENFKNK